jgi:transketolase
VIEVGRAESLREAYGETLVELGSKDPKLLVFAAGPSESMGTAPFGAQYADRFFEGDGEAVRLIATAAERSRDGRTVFASMPVEVAAGAAYGAVRESVSPPRTNVKIVAVHPGESAPDDGTAPPIVEDVGIMRGLPGLSVIVPADAPTTRAVTRAVAAQAGPVYVRLSAESWPTVTDGSFVLGRAAELRPGTDLTIVALGRMVAEAITAAEDLSRVGVSVRVLDFASVKPFDEPALLRAARDTGAILVLEDHSVLTGVGALVAATTSENYPVPVRRVGVPDLFGAPGEAWSRRDPYGLSRERVRDESWELLRMRGKVQ